MVLSSKDHKSLVALDKRYVWHPFTQMRDWIRSDPTLIVKGRGSYVFDANGKRYLDANSSIWTNLHGHQHPHLSKAISQQLKRVAHSSYLGLANKPASLLAEKLVRLAPKSLKKVFYSDDGTTAVEVALKMAVQAQNQESGVRSRKMEGGRSAECGMRNAEYGNQKTSFLALENAYHGDTIGAMSLGGIDVFHKAYKSLMFRTEKVMAPYCYRCPYNRARPERADAREYRKCNWECISQVEQKLSNVKKKNNSFRWTIDYGLSTRFAAAVIEPLIQGAAGMIAHPIGYLKRFAKLCHEKNMLLIADEVMTGFGRTGTMFACEQEQVSPDFLCLAKGLTGGYLPLAATLTTQQVFDAFLGDYSEMKTFFHGHSYTANQLGCAAALANLEIFSSKDVLTTVIVRSLELGVMLQRFWKLSHVGDVRQVGLIGGIELVKNWKTREPYSWKDRVGVRVCEEAKRQGILTRPIGNVLVMMPPYCTTPSQIEKICRVLEKSVQKVCG